MAMNAYDRDGGGSGSNGAYGDNSNNGDLKGHLGSGHDLNSGGTGSTLPAIIQAALRTRNDNPIDYEHYGMTPMHSYFNYS